MEEPGAICRGTVDCHSFCLFDALLFLSGMLGTRLNHPYVLCSVRSQAPRSSMTLSCPGSLSFLSSSSPGKPYGGVFRVRAKSQRGSGPGDSPAALMCSVGGLFCELLPGLASESPAAV